MSDTDAKVLFISVFNYGSIRLAKNHIQSLLNCGLTNYMAFVTDDESAEELSKSGYTNITRVNEDGVTPDKKDFGSEEFNGLSYLRYKIIYGLLKQGIHVWYMDVDTVCVKTVIDFCERFMKIEEDIVFQSDLSMLCTGCMLVRPSERSINLMEVIYGNRTKEDNDQIFLRKYMSFMPNTFKHAIFPIHQFPCGVLYFDAEFVNITPDVLSMRKIVKPETVLFVHANWMIGNTKKEDAFKSKNLWFIE